MSSIIKLVAQYQCDLKKKQQTFFVADDLLPVQRYCSGSFHFTFIVACSGQNSKGYALQTNYHGRRNANHSFRRRHFCLTGSTPCLLRRTMTLLDSARISLAPAIQSLIVIWRRVVC
jgi:hypothetical protein